MIGLAAGELCMGWDCVGFWMDIKTKA